MRYNYQEIASVRAYKRADESCRNSKKREKFYEEDEGVSFDTAEIIAFFIFIVTMIIKTVEVIL